MLNIPCTNCTNSIINQDISLIGHPFCVNPCPPDTGCTYWQNTSCTIYNGVSLSCLNIPSGSNLNTLLAAINTEICNLAPPSGATSTCQIYSSCTDPCPSSLVNKITSNTLNVSLSTNGITQCQTVDIEDKSWIFTNVNTVYSQPNNIISGPYTYLFTPVRYGVRNGYPTTNNLLEVRFHGQLFIPSGVSQTGLFTLPLALRPTTDKFYSLNAFYPGVTNFYLLYISSITGLVSITIQLVDSPTIVSFDGLNFIKN